jgi:hypothetical protein
MKVFIINIGMLSILDIRGNTKVSQMVIINEENRLKDLRVNCSLKRSPSAFHAQHYNPFITEFASSNLFSSLGERIIHSQPIKKTCSLDGMREGLLYTIDIRHLMSQVKFGGLLYICIYAYEYVCFSHIYIYLNICVHIYIYTYTIINDFRIPPRKVKAFP